MLFWFPSKTGDHNLIKKSTVKLNFNFSFLRSKKINFIELAKKKFCLEGLKTFKNVWQKKSGLE